MATYRFILIFMSILIASLTCRSIFALPIVPNLIAIKTCENIPPLQDVNWMNFRSRLEQQPEVFNSLERALCLLRGEEKYSSVAVAFRSRSFQEGSLEQPRVMLGYDNFIFGQEEDGSFSRSDQVPTKQMFLSFNGSLEQRQGHSIEVITFDKTQPPKEKIKMFDVSFEKGLHISDPNPAKCIKCHGQNPRLLFNTRGQWPGMFLLTP